MRARPGQMRAAREFLKQFHEPRLVIPGNHDVPLYDLLTRIVRPFHNFNKYTGDLSTNPLKLGNVSMIGLNTVNPARHQEGRVLKADFERVRQWSRQAPSEDWRVVVVHQHFANIAGHERPGVMANGGEALEMFAEAGVHAVLHGHTHYNRVTTAGEFFPHITRPIALVCVSTATSHRVRGEVPANSYNMLQFENDRFIVRQCDWQQEFNHFAECRQTTFSRKIYDTTVPL